MKFRRRIHASLLTTLAVAVPVGLAVSACPDQLPADIECPVLSTYTSALCDTYGESVCGSNVIEAPERGDWGTQHSTGDDIIVGGGKSKLCYSTARCNWNATVLKCMPGEPTKHNKAVNKDNGSCGG
jgi:hypothetical protein